MTDIQNENETLSEAEEALMNEFREALETPTLTLLDTWSNLLGNIEGERESRVSPALANKITTVWPKMSFQDVPRYFAAYYDHMELLREDLLDIIAENPEALEHVEDDMEFNHELYLELLYRWQVRIGIWEHEWDAAAEDSHISIAAIADSTSFFVGPQGLVEHLTAAGFNFTDEERAALEQRLVEAREAL